LCCSRWWALVDFKSPLLSYSRRYSFEERNEIPRCFTHRKHTMASHHTLATNLITAPDYCVPSSRADSAHMKGERATRLDLPVLKGNQYMVSLVRVLRPPLSPDWDEPPSEMGPQSPPTVHRRFSPVDMEADRLTEAVYLSPKSPFALGLPNSSISAKTRGGWSRLSLHIPPGFSHLRETINAILSYLSVTDN
jgi:hypothetical protein